MESVTRSDLYAEYLREGGRNLGRGRMTSNFFPSHRQNAFGMEKLVQKDIMNMIFASDMEPIKLTEIQELSLGTGSSGERVGRGMETGDGDDLRGVSTSLPMSRESIWTTPNSRRVFTSFESVEEQLAADLGAFAFDFADKVTREVSELMESPRDQAFFEISCDLGDQDEKSMQHESRIASSLPRRIETVADVPSFGDFLLHRSNDKNSEEYCSTFYKKNTKGYMFIREPSNSLKVNNSGSRSWVQMKIRLPKASTSRTLRVDVHQIPIWRPVSAGSKDSPRRKKLEEHR